MCGRYTFTQTPDASLLIFPDGIEVNTGPRFNIAPSQYNPVIPMADARKIHYFKWGLIPSWAKDPKIGFRMINARSETVFEKPAFREGIWKRRCLVLADGFYEWKKTGQGKVPHWISLSDQRPFYFGGLSEVWRDPHGWDVESFSILTTRPNEVMANIHDRMPVILEQDRAKAWLRNSLTQQDIQALCEPIPSDMLDVRPVSTDVGNVRNDYPELIKRQDGLLGLF
ncbi:SOS response-associated peptidase [Pontibacter sp. G13]|uniref:SOS response-associated peptidase n=1 Tax=Pontibacter sp. G13 TaxID=3074898 RepID=UPI002889A136|nr:SOS response-associated peptidase [Pontibacter sp. G13]WNJ19420.1 SOS response-associated peptidase [Pontibacter sp. G13]